MTDVATPASEHTQPTMPSSTPPTAPANEGTPLWKRKIMWPVYGLLGLVAIGAAVGGGERAETDGSVETVETVPVPSTVAMVDPDAATEVATVPEPEAIATRDNPLPLGASIEVTAEALGDADDSVWSLTVTGPVRDVTSEARTEGLAADPLAGNVIVGVPFELTLVDAGKEPLAPLFNVEVDYFSPEMLGIAETLLACGLWNEAFKANTELFIGGTISGLLCAEVPAVDLEGGLLVTADEAGDRVFLATE